MIRLHIYDPSLMSGRLKAILQEQRYVVLSNVCSALVLTYGDIIVIALILPRQSVTFL